MVIMDATALLMLLNERTSPPRHPDTDLPITDAHERIKHAVKQIRDRGEKILIASPVLAELLVRCQNAASEYIREFNESAHFKPVSFDQIAAIRHAEYTKKAIDAGDKKSGAVEDSSHKVKFDRQIVAIAETEGATTIYTDDKRLGNHAESRGLKVIRTHEIILDVQQTLFPENLAETETAISFAAGTDEGKVKSRSAGTAPVNTIDEAEEKTAPIAKGDTVVKTMPPPLIV